MKTRRLANLQALRDLAQEISEQLHSRLLILLDGPMGSGKTQFTKYLLESLGSDDAISPSFSIHNSYETTRGVVHHFDLFRLENADDLESTGFWDLFGGGSGDDGEQWVIIEWAEKLNDFGQLAQLPTAWKKIRLTFAVDQQNQDRIITLDI